VRRVLALRAGLSAYAVTALVLATLALPWVSHLDFGHFHPDHTPSHVHTLSSLFQAKGSSSGPSLEIKVSSSFIGPSSSTTVIVDTVPAYPVGSRAPPL